MKGKREHLTVLECERQRPMRGSLSHERLTAEADA